MSNPTPEPSDPTPSDEIDWSLYYSSIKGGPTPPSETEQTPQEPPD